MNQQVITGTLVIVAAEGASDQQLCEAVNQAATVHGRPVIVLAHNWAALPVELVRAQLDAIEASTKRLAGATLGA